MDLQPDVGIITEQTDWPSAVLLCDSTRARFETTERLLWIKFIVQLSEI